VQITGAPARRANPQRGLIAAGGAAVRALTHAAAQELRDTGIHVALLIVDGIIASPKTAKMTSGMSTDALVRPQDVSEAVRFLATQSARGLSHELVITPSGDRWLP
jgi:NAD(P)-dependent dehydrogenase (short-subunit alcohol dehydrogenase family)